jgi:hypothetical protein
MPCPIPSAKALPSCSLVTPTILMLSFLFSIKLDVTSIKLDVTPESSDAFGLAHQAQLQTDCYIAPNSHFRERVGYLVSA